jgi:2-C-methyl-D-erythritol 4-phosphate cytidylyltransferase
MNHNRETFTVCIPAAGTGSRMLSDTPKQYLTIAGRPVLAHILTLFDAMDSCARIILAGDAERLERVLETCSLRTEHRIVAGGATRQESVASMLYLCEDDDEIVLVHDAARPCIDQADILAVVEAVEQHGAAILALPASDTVKRVHRDFVVSTLDRSEIWLAQTPQGARNGLLQRALREAAQSGSTYTDEASLLESINFPVRVLRGSVRNLKITTTDDLVLAEAILASRRESA